jgi:hypothetical protein
MRLLNVETLQLKTFSGNDVPDYVVLSHTWEDEVTFEDIAKEAISDESASCRQKSGFSKIQGACNKAASHGYQWIWIDSCCIDKSSSAELQEAINSMWNWYKNANVCYTYLVDVPNEISGWTDAFRNSRWFTRGWTLQELIAPWSVEFYAADWSEIGTKLRRLDEIHEITGIRKSVLQTSNPENEKVAEILSWAAHRDVTREEDIAYSLMGLFDINMPMLYGEGGTKAFLRLQQAIFRRKPDHSIFLYTYCGLSSPPSLLADNPAQFCRKINCAKCPSASLILFPRGISYKSLSDRPLRSSETVSVTSDDDIILRHEGQEVTLKIVDGDRTKDIIYEYPISDSDDALQKPGFWRPYDVALLSLKHRNGGRLAFRIRAFNTAYYRYQRIALPVVLYKGEVKSLGRKRFLISSVYQGSSSPHVVSSSRHRIELNSSTFKFEPLEGELIPWQKAVLIDGEMSLHFRGHPWKCELIVSSLKDTKHRIRLTLQSDDRLPQNCRIIKVEETFDRLTAKIRTLENFFSDQFDLPTQDNMENIVISVRRLPTMQGDGPEPIYKHQLEVKRVSRSVNRN